MAKAIPTMLAQFRLALTKVKLHEMSCKREGIQLVYSSLRNKQELPSPSVLVEEHLSVTPKSRKMRQEQQLMLQQQENYQSCQ